MRRGYFALLLTAAAVALAPLPGFAQSSDVPRTAWDEPDLQGAWDFATLTPMERPPEFADRATLTEEDVANIVARSAQFTQFLSENGTGSSDTRTGTYDEFRFDFGSDVSPERAPQSAPRRERRGAMGSPQADAGGSGKAPSD